MSEFKDAAGDAVEEEFQAELKECKLKEMQVTNAEVICGSEGGVKHGLRSLCW